MLKAVQARALHTDLHLQTYFHIRNNVKIVMLMFTLGSDLTQGLTKLSALIRAPSLDSLVHYLQPCTYSTAALLLFQQSFTSLTGQPEGHCKNEVDSERSCSFLNIWCCLNNETLSIIAGTKPGLLGR